MNITVLIHTGLYDMCIFPAQSFHMNSNNRMFTKMKSSTFVLKAFIRPVYSFVCQCLQEVFGNFIIVVCFIKGQPCCIARQIDKNAQGYKSVNCALNTFLIHHCSYTNGESSIIMNLSRRN